MNLMPIALLVALLLIPLAAVGKQYLLLSDPPLPPDPPSAWEVPAAMMEPSQPQQASSGFGSTGGDGSEIDPEGVEMNDPTWRGEAPDDAPHYPTG